jgi:hypothetical protein
LPAGLSAGPTAGLPADLAACPHANFWRTSRPARILPILGEEEEVPLPQWGCPFGFGEKEIIVTTTRPDTK